VSRTKEQKRASWRRNVLRKCEQFVSRTQHEYFPIDAWSGVETVFAHVHSLGSFNTRKFWRIQPRKRR
jgi:hypothetical protein